MRRSHLRHSVLWNAVLLLGASSGSMAEGAVYVLPSGHAVDARGNVVADDLQLTPDDKVVGEDGHAYDSGQLHLGPQGELLTPGGTPVKKGFRLQPRAAGQAAVITSAGEAATGRAAGSGSRKGPGVKMVVGGQSEEGVAKTTTLPIIK